MMNFTGQFCSRLQFEGLVMMENRPTVTRFRSGMVWNHWQRSAFLANNEIESVPRCAFNRAAGAASTAGQSQWVAKSARWDGLTFCTKGENIVWSSGSQLCPRGGLTLFSPLANSFILNHRKWLVAPSELLKRGPS